VLVEECLTGQEASVLALTDGLTSPCYPLRITSELVGDGERIPVVWELMPQLFGNTGFKARIEQVLQPAIATRQRGIDSEVFSTRV